jgi:hypothetical protein
MSKKYTVRTFTWNNGVLNIKDHQFNDKHSALNFGQTAGCDQSKVTDPDNRVIYQQKNSQVIQPKPVKNRRRTEETYA